MRSNREFHRIPPLLSTPNSLSEPVMDGSPDDSAKETPKALERLCQIRGVETPSPRTKKFTDLDWMTEFVKKPVSLDFAMPTEERRDCLNKSLKNILELLLATLIGDHFERDKRLSRASTTASRVWQILHLSEKASAHKPEDPALPQLKALQN
jgi:hypothetical protein